MLNTRVIEAVKRLVDEANGSFVVLHAIDTKRLVPPEFGVADEDLKAPAPGRGPASARSRFVPETDLRGGQPTPVELACQ